MTSGQIVGLRLLGKRTHVRVGHESGRINSRVAVDLLHLGLAERALSPYLTITAAGRRELHRCQTSERGSKEVTTR